jgi:hypothetical protein
MLGELRACARRGATIVSINPLRERGLERFTDPQAMGEMLTGGSTRIASLFIQPRLGGDLALIKGVAKRLLDADARQYRPARRRPVPGARPLERAGRPTRSHDQYNTTIRRLGRCTQQLGRRRRHADLEIDPGAVVSRPHVRRGRALGTFIMCGPAKTILSYSSLIFLAILQCW